MAEEMEGVVAADAAQAEQDPAQKALSGEYLVALP